MSTRRQGFTLVELMVAMIAGAFAVAAVYYLNGVSSRSFAEQMRISETQMSLRSAMEQLRREFSRAGYLSTPSSKLIPDCGGAPDTGGMGGISPRPMQAISVTQDGSTADATVATLAGVATNKTRADSVDVWGNYATPEVYLVDPTGTNASTIKFQPGSEAFRRSFYAPAAANAAATYTAATFTSVFAPGRMVRIENEGRYFFSYIVPGGSTAVNSLLPGDGPSITISPSLPSCFEPSTWSTVTPVMHMRYALEADNTADLGRLQSQATATATAATNIPGGRRNMLVRREWNDSTSTAVAGTSGLILDYAVEFAVDAWVNTAVFGARPTWSLQRGANVTTQSSTTPQNFRSLLVTLTARSAEVDPKFPAMPARSPFNDATLLDAPLLQVRVIDPLNNTAMYARTRTMRSEIFLQNL